jgi:hypothetical protein
MQTLKSFFDENSSNNNHGIVFFNCSGADITLMLRFQMGEQIRRCVDMLPCRYYLRTGFDE